MGMLNSKSVIEKKMGKKWRNYNLWLLCYRYSKVEVGYGLRANQNNPEVSLTNRNTNPLITEQMAELNKATRHLNNAKLGINVDWLDFDGEFSLEMLRLLLQS